MVWLGALLGAIIGLLLLSLHKQDEIQNKQDELTPR